MKMKFAGEIMSSESIIDVVFRSLKRLKCWTIRLGDNKRIWLLSGRVAKAYQYVLEHSDADDFTLEHYRYDRVEANYILSELIFKHDWQSFETDEEIVVCDFDVPEEWHIRWVVDGREFTFDNKQMAEELEGRVRAKTEREKNSKFFSTIAFMQVDQKTIDHLLYVAVISGDTSKAAALMDDLFGPSTSLDWDMSKIVRRTMTPIGPGDEQSMLFKRVIDTYPESERRRGVFKAGNLFIIDDVSEPREQSKLQTYLAGWSFQRM